MDLLKGAHRVERSDFVVDREHMFLADLNDPLQLASMLPEMLRPWQRARDAHIPALTVGTHPHEIHTLQDTSPRRGERVCTARKEFSERLAQLWKAARSTALKTSHHRSA
jgi:hypothetical protein